MTISDSNSHVLLKSATFFDGQEKKNSGDDSGRTQESPINVLTQHRASVELSPQKSREHRTFAGSSFSDVEKAKEGNQRLSAQVNFIKKVEPAPLEIQSLNKAIAPGAIQEPTPDKLGTIMESE
jgi:hypothetical protein